MRKSKGLKERERLMRRAIEKENAPRVELSIWQYEKLWTVTWFIYGNLGPKHSHANHKFIQGLIEQEKDYRDFYDVSSECLEAVDAILRVAPAEAAP